MSNKYFEAISQIKADDELNEEIVKRLEQENNKKYKGGIIIKLRKMVATISAILGVAACGGLAYAGITGKLSSKPNVEDYGITFSEDYEEYEELFESQYVEKDGTTVRLESAVCNEGFIVLKFDITLSDELKEIAEESAGLSYLSYNNKSREDLGEANYNLIIDGKKEWVRGRYANDLQENVGNKNYTSYQLYYLPDTIIGNKKTFTITLEDIRLVIEEKIFEIDGNFKFELSKEKALNNTTEFLGNDTSITYRSMEEKIDKVVKTPLQTIIKVTDEISVINSDGLFDLADKNYAGDILYKVYDQNGKELTYSNMDTRLQYLRKDGTLEEGDIEEGKDSYDDYKKLIYEKHIVTEKSKEITALRIEVYSENDYYETIRHIGTYNIDLNSNNITSENSKQDKEIKILNIYESYENEVETNNIEHFTIGINEPYNIYKELCYHDSNDETTYKEYENIIGYRINSSMFGEFRLAVFEDKNDYNNYIFEEGEEIKTLVIDENDESMVVLLLDYEHTYEKVKHIVDTIKLK